MAISKIDNRKFRNVVALLYFLRMFYFREWLNHGIWNLNLHDLLEVRSFRDT
jgi:hypothetical protein